MPRRTEVFVRKLTGPEGQRLVRRVHASLDWVPRRRAMIVLASAQGRPAEEIAMLIQGSAGYVREVIHAFNEHGFKALEWTQNGAGAGPLEADKAIMKAIAATPWPAPLTRASHSPAGPEVIGPRLQLPRPETTGRRASQFQPHQQPEELAPPQVARRQQPDPHPRHAPAPASIPSVDKFGALLQSEEGNGMGKLYSELPHAVEPYQLDDETTYEEVARELRCSTENFRNGTGQDEVDRKRAGLGSDERQRLRELERENTRLREEREILKAAVAFFATESQRIG